MEVVHHSAVDLPVGLSQFLPDGARQAQADMEEVFKAFNSNI